MLAQSNGDNHGNAAAVRRAAPLEEEELIQSQLSKELEEICNAAVQEVSAKCAETSPVQGDGAKIEPDIKVEPGEADTKSSEVSAPLSNNSLNSSRIGSAEPPTSADEATQNLLNNLSNITSISEINEITELTQSLVESLVQVSSFYWSCSINFDFHHYYHRHFYAMLYSLPHYHQ